VNDPIAAPAITSVGKCFPDVTRNTAVAVAADKPTIQTGVIQGESGYRFLKTVPAKTAPLKADAACPEINEEASAVLNGPSVS